jgi:bifunctional N-acetylglucosamine-1-phosphate-uridyltransferase/glucosamine-1-phosphate-acetyltransferase GlmU-like protein
MELIVIAAGNGKRMGDISVPKVLYPVNGVPNLKRILDQAIDSKIIHHVFIVVKDTASDDFEKYLTENPFKISTTIVPINSGLGDGHAIMSALENINTDLEEAIVMWGDTYIEYSSTFKELIRYKCSSVTLPVVKEDNPYVTILTDESMKVISADFSKLGEKHLRGLHDQSVFMINKAIVLRTLRLMHNVLWKNGRYITESKELNFLHIFHYLWNINEPAICYITEYPTKSFNSIEEVKQIENN